LVHYGDQPFRYIILVCKCASCCLDTENEVVAGFIIVRYLHYGWTRKISHKYGHVAIYELEVTK
jgi:hypothetical protein